MTGVLRTRYSDDLQLTFTYVA